MIPYVSIMLVKVITTRQGRDQRVESQIPTPSLLSKNIPPIQVVLPKTNIHLPQVRMNISLGEQVVEHQSRLLVCQNRHHAVHAAHGLKVEKCHWPFFFFLICRKKKIRDANYY